LDDVTLKLYNTQAEALAGPKTFAPSGVDSTTNGFTIPGHGFTPNQAVTYLAPSAARFSRRTSEVAGWTTT